MNLMFRPLSLLLLYCATQALGVQIESKPGVDSDGVIQTKPDETISLVCEVESSHDPQEELVWLRNGAVVSLKEGNKEGRSSLCITPIIEDNGAIFTCRLKKNATDSDSVTLNVKYPPNLGEATTVTLEEEEKLLLQCDIRANPLVSDIIWLLNGSQVDLIERGFLETNDGFISQLSVDFVDRSLHEGTYNCSVNYPDYGILNQAFYVTVTDKTMKFPLIPIIAGLVVVFLTVILAVVSRWNKITKCCK